MKHFSGKPAWAVIAIGFGAGVCQAQTADAQLGTVTIRAPGAAKDKGAVSIRNEALPAQVNVIDADQIERMNVRTYTDLYRAVPGVQAINFGQGDIGSPFVLRGFGGEGSHGIATAVYIDGVPQNIPSDRIGGNGTTEYNWLTPEMVERIEVIKGPFSALYGDQALAGVVNITTKTCAPTAVSVEAGRYGFGRVAGAGCKLLGADQQIKAFGAFDAQRSDGYRDRSEYGRISLFGKLTMPVGDSEVSLRANVYRSEYDAPGYLTQALLDQYRAGRLDPRKTPYASDGGDTTRYGLVANVKPRSGEAGWYGTAYFERLDRNRFGSFNPLLPLAQNQTITDRDVFGGRAYYNFLLADRGAVTVGAETRQDRGDAGSFATNNRVRTGVVNDAYGLDIGSYSAFVQAQYKVLDQVKVVGGYRYDRFEQDIENRTRPGRSGSGNQSIGTPRVGVVYTVNPSLNLFANAGRGFRSLAANELSPSAALGFKNFNLDIPKGDTRDVGFNARFDGLQLNGSVYRTNIKSELQQDPPGSGVLVNVGDSQRNGYEFDARYLMSEAVTMYGSFAHVDAKVKNPLIAAQTRLQNVVPNLVTLGVEVTQPLASGRMLYDLYFQHRDRSVFYIGNTEVKNDIYQIYNARLTYESGKAAYTAYLILQPRRFASEQAGASFLPLPRTNFGVSYKYTF